MPRITQIIETLEAERAEVQARLEWLDLRIDEFRQEAASRAAAPAPHVEPPARSDRRATARRASARRHAARAVKRDVAEEIVKFLKKHPGSTAGEVAKGLNADRPAIAGRLTVMTKSGELVKAKRGYAVKQ